MGFIGNQKSISPETVRAGTESQKSQPAAASAKAETRTDRNLGGVYRADRYRVVVLHVSK